MKNFTYAILMILIGFGRPLVTAEKLGQDEKAFISSFTPTVVSLEEAIATRCPNTLWTRSFGESTECRNARNNKRDFIFEFGNAIKSYHRKKLNEAKINEYHACNNHIVTAYLFGGNKRCTQAEIIRRYHADILSRLNNYDQNALEALIKQAAEAPEQTQSANK